MNAFDAAAISADGRSWEAIHLPPLPAEPSVSYFDRIFFYGPESALGADDMAHLGLETSSISRTDEG